MNHKKMKSHVQCSERIILVKIEIKPKDAIIALVYMPPSNSNDDQAKEVSDKMEEDIDGDYNLVMVKCNLKFKNV